MKEHIANAALVVLTAALVAIAFAIVSHRPGSGSGGPTAKDPGTGETGAAIESLGSVETFPLDEPFDPASGVTIWESERAQKGVNLYNPRDCQWAALLDMAGGELHRWAPSSTPGPHWTFAEPIGGGDIVAVLRDHSLVRVSHDSRVLWQVPMRAHHEVALSQDGTILALSRRDRIATVDGVEIPILGDEIVHLTPHGEILETIELWPHLIEWLPQRKIERIRALEERESWIEAIRRVGPGERILQPDTLPDFAHVSSVELVEIDLPGVFRRGDLLLMPRNLNRVVVFDPDARRVRWSRADQSLQRPHQATVTAEGHLLLFDTGTRRRWSRVVEVDPLRGAVVWQFGGDDDQRFFSAGGGGCQRLPNGNTLITVSGSGRVLEVTAAGDIVWEFICPRVRPDRERGGLARSVVFRLVRITDPAAWGLVDRLP